MALVRTRVGTLRPMIPSAEPTRFFFVHVQKTAGTSLFIRFGNQFAPSEIYPDDTDGGLMTDMPQLKVDRLLQRWVARREQIRVVAGHFPLCTVQLLDAPFVTLTVVREPVARTLSYLRHHRKILPEARDASLEQIYDDPLRFEGLVHNHMVKMFSLSTDEMDDGVMTRVEFTRERLERAKQGLASVDVLGLQEDFETFCTDLEQRFGWDLGDPAVANDTEPTEVPAGLLDRIAEDNALDAELYEYAVALVRSRREATACARPADGVSARSPGWCAERGAVRRARRASPAASCRPRRGSSRSRRGCRARWRRGRRRCRRDRARRARP